MSYITYVGGCFVDNLAYCGKPEGRNRWMSPKGRFYEWDHFHGDHFEIYNKRGEHLGEAACDGSPRGKPDSSKKIEPICKVRPFRKED